jgi:hypothetical protein
VPDLDILERGNGRVHEIDINARDTAGCPRSDGRPVTAPVPGSRLLPRHGRGLECKPPRTPENRTC